MIRTGVETKKDANKEILRFDTNTSGREVKIILWFGESTNNENNGLVKISPRYLTLKKKKLKSLKKEIKS